MLYFQVRLYLIVLGFSVGFGALFAKTWRVYKIMTASNRLSKVTKVGTAIFCSLLPRLHTLKIPGKLEGKEEQGKFLRLSLET